MTKKVVFVYEVTQNVSRLPELNEVEEAIFDIINEEGAASMKAVVNDNPQHDGYAIREALRSLTDKGLIERRNVTLGSDE